MDIFESLENLEVSEACFNEIIGLVEAVLSEALPNEVEKRYPKEQTQQEYDREYDKGNFNSPKFKELARRLGLHHDADENARKSRVASFRHGGFSKRERQDLQNLDKRVEGDYGSHNNDHLVTKDKPQELQQAKAEVRHYKKTGDKKNQAAAEKRRDEAEKKREGVWAH